jgi:CDP-diacylglycerol--glycerol-3-phosphate 3-phosphatidyltransferase
MRQDHRDVLWTVPNVICLLRGLGTGPLLWAASRGHRDIFLWLMIFLLLSDWLDGKLATILDQRTTLGSRLDSVADALMYAAIALSFWWLERDAIRDQTGWIVAVLASWSASVAVGLVRFRRLPSYHTWAAKISWFGAACAALYLLLAGDPVLLPWALGLAVFTNLHAVAVGLSLPRWEADVWSLREAWRMRRGKP